MSDLADRMARLPEEERRRVLQQVQARRRAASPRRIPRVPRDGGAFPLSFAQERLWFLDQLVPGNPFYTICSAHWVPFAIDHGGLERALTELVRRHEALRTTFPIVDGEPRQKISPPGPVLCSVVDLGPVPPFLRERETQRLGAEAAQTSFELETGPLFAARLIRLGPGESVFVFVIHHIVADGWSMELLFRELSVLYGDALTRRAPLLPEPTVQYVDFAVWERAWLAGEVMEQQLAYWRSALDGLTPLNLPTDRPRPPVQTYKGAQL